MFENWFLNFLLPSRSFMIAMTVFLIQWGINSYFFNRQSLSKTLVNMLSFYIGVKFIHWMFLRHINVPHLATAYDLSDFWNKHYVFTAFLVIIVQEFFMYAGHLVCHRNKLLWAVHEPHHSVTELNMSASLRTGWFMPIVYTVSVGPMVLLFTGLNMDPKFMLIPGHVSIMLYQILIHTGLTYKNKYLSKIFILPGDHAKHHEIAPDCQNSNFGSCLSIFDHLFGTYNGTPNTEIYGCSAQRSDELNIFRIQLGPIARAWKILNFGQKAEGPEKILKVKN